MFFALVNCSLIALQLFLFCFTGILSHSLSLFVNQSTSYSQIKLWSYFTIFNHFFKQVDHKGIEISKEHQQRGPPYRKTLSQGQFPISISSTSTSANTNIVFPCKLCNENINDRDAAIQCNICQFWVYWRSNKLNLVDDKYLQGSTDSWFCLSCCSVILPFWNLTDKEQEYLITTLKSPIKIVQSS